MRFQSIYLPWGLSGLALGVLACGVGWWLWSVERCGPENVGRLWFTMDGEHTTISAYCDSEGRYVPLSVPWVVPLPDRLPQVPME